MRQIQMEDMGEFGGGDYGASTYSPNDPVEPVRVYENATISTGQYGEAVAVSESDPSSTGLELPFLMGQVSNSAPGYDFSGLFGREQSNAPETIIDKVMQWVRQIFS